jgi:CheY-like chemotaxis protein
MLRMRGRPKIILAKIMMKQLAYYNQYKHNLLGIISDVSFKINNQRDHKTMAGLQLCKMVKQEDAQLPFLLQSSDKSNEERANQLGAGFL